MDPKTETRAVKQALKTAGIPYNSVRHGRGTACGWLSIHLPANVFDALSSQARAVAVDALGRKSDVVEPSGERVHNECVNIHRDTEPLAGWTPPAPEPPWAPDAHLEQEYEDRMAGGAVDYPEA
jgi:hypothetical protein